MDANAVTAQVLSFMALCLIFYLQNDRRIRRRVISFRSAVEKGTLTPEMVKSVSSRTLWLNNYTLYAYFLRLIKNGEHRKIESLLGWIKKIRNRKKREALSEAVFVALRKANQAVLDKLYLKTKSLGRGNNLTASVIEEYRQNYCVNL